PARPRSVVIIESMPMTNVGKIYKPELRALAACRVAQALVDEACAALGLTGAQRPQVKADSDNALQVVIDTAATGPLAAQLQTQLQQVLERLPVKVQVRVQ
ncbi:MAG: acyl-CoA synthetase, partial [Polaromonas sp.]|nr:acyl-CoA synthetase [Polaromonas sp.]